MIRSFVDKETEKVYHQVRSAKLPPDIQHVAMRKLWILDAATNINDLRVPPGNRLEKLKGNNTARYSIRINNQWRICFIWNNNNAYSVEITDYHS